MSTRVRHPETKLHRVADSHVAKLTVAIEYAFANGRKALRKDFTNVSKAVAAVRASLLDVLAPTLLKILIDGGTVGLEMLATRLRHAELRTLKPQVKGEPHSKEGAFGLAFNVSDPNAGQWAREHGAELAKNLSETTERDIRNAIEKAVSGGGIETAYQEILDAVGSSARAELIARTEVMTAANEGQRQSWDQAVDEGLLDPDVRVQWIATGDDIVCPICEELDGETRTLDGEYSEPGGEGPPAHPNCRCTEGIVG